MLCVDVNKVVALRYIMRNRKGVVLEDTMQLTPTHYLHGSSSILPLLQTQLQGLKTGDKKQVSLSKQISEADDDFIFDVVIDDVREALPEEIILGYPIQIITEVCNDDCYCYDESQK